MELVPTKEPASHLASRRSTGSLPNASNRAEAHTHYFVTKSAARVTPCGRGHSTLRSLAPQFQTKPASLGFCLVEGKERYGGKYAKKQAIQYSDLITGFRDYSPKGSAGAHEPERLCDCLLSWKTYCDSERAIIGFPDRFGPTLNFYIINIDGVRDVVRYIHYCEF